MSKQEGFDPELDVQNSRVSRRAARSVRRMERRADRDAGGLRWVWGILLVALGGLFMLQNAGYFSQFSNWWALFILLPAAGSFSAALGAYRRQGNEWTGAATGPLLAGVLLLGLTAVFLFNLSLSLFGPLLLIGAGLLVLVFGLR